MNYLAAKDAMNPHVICVPGEWTVKELAQFLREVPCTKS